MFLHSFKYQFRKLYRQKIFFFWNLLFPILLSCLFYAGFSNLSNSELFHAIPVALVISPDQDTTVFQEAISSVDQNSEEPLLKVTTLSNQEALDLLDAKKIAGILTLSDKITLTLPQASGTAKLSQSILNSFVDSLNLNKEQIETIHSLHPEKIQEAVAQMCKTKNYTQSISYSNGDMSESLTYFFNLIAMVCLYGHMVGCKVAMENKANISVVGRFKSATAIHRLPSILGELSASFVYQFSCVLITLLFMAGPLGINFGSEFGSCILICLAGCFSGISLGYFIGSLSFVKENVKIGILMAVSMINCFLSGLMAGSIRILVEKYCSWFNKINPAALISDSFYSLTVYQSHSRLFENLLCLLILSVVLSLGGYFMTRREKYASL